MTSPVFRLVRRIAPIAGAALVGLGLIGLTAPVAFGESDIKPLEPDEAEDLDACVKYVLAKGTDTLRTIRPEKWTETKKTGMFWALEQAGVPEMLVGRLFQYHVICGYSDFHAKWLYSSNICRANRVAILALVECLGRDAPNPHDFLADARRFEPVERAQREEEIRLVRKQRVRFAKEFLRALELNPSKSQEIRQIRDAFKKAAEVAGEFHEKREAAPQEKPVENGVKYVSTPEAEMKRIADEVIAASRILATTDPDSGASTKEISARESSNDPRVAVPALLEASLRFRCSSGVSKYRWFLCGESERATRMAIVALGQSLATDLPLACFDGEPERFATPGGMYRQEELDFAKKNKQMFARAFCQALEKNPSKSPKIKELQDCLRSAADMPENPDSVPSNPTRK
jgi:hypothetical protein